MTMNASKWRRRHLALDRKGQFETEMLNSDDDDLSESADLPAKMDKNAKAPPLSSPNSVASAFDIPLEMQSITLPGAWTTVGKGGKPLKNAKMYDEPVSSKPLTSKPVTCKNSKKKSKKKMPDEMEAELEQLASSSKCFLTLDRSATQHNKVVARSQEAKRWAKYNHGKQLKREALEELLAAMSSPDDDSVHVAPVKPAKDNKANSIKDKARRRARSAATAMRCFPYEFEEMKIEEAAEEATVRGEPLLLFGSKVVPAHDVVVRELKLPGAWTTIGKGGKSLSDFPPLSKTPKERTPDRTSKRRNSSDESSLKAAKHDTTSKTKCLLM